MGALVGAGATLTANWISARTQLRLADDNREQQRAEVRRSACAEYLIAADAFVDQARELVSRMDSNSSESEIHAAHKSYQDGWGQLKRACAPAVIAGPSELKDRAEELMSRLADLGYERDNWYTAHRNGSARSRASKVINARHAIGGTRDLFVSIVQKYAYPDSSKSADWH